MKGQAGGELVGRERLTGGREADVRDGFAFVSQRLSDGGSLGMREAQGAEEQGW